MSEQIPYKIYLSENEMPTAWYNLRADMKNKPAPLLNPGTGKPMTFDDLRPVFCDELVRQELDNDTPYIEIPAEIRDFYKMYRPSPLVRAYCLEKKLGSAAAGNLRRTGKDGDPLCADAHFCLCGDNALDQHHQGPLGQSENAADCLDGKCQLLYAVVEGGKRP